MIKFSLVCQAGHEFEGWFQSGDAYDAQRAQAHIACPCCGSLEVEKAIMAPTVATRRTSEPDVPRPSYEPPRSAEELRQVLRSIRDAVHAKADYVGGRFAEEARRIHFAERPSRGVYGEASADEVKELAEEGIPVLPVPRLPEDLN